MYSKKSRGSSHSQQEEKFSLVYYSLWRGQALEEAAQRGRGISLPHDFPEFNWSRPWAVLLWAGGWIDLSHLPSCSFPLTIKKKNNWQSFSPKPHTKNILCYSSPSPFWYIFTYFKAESLNLLSSDEVVSCIHKSTLGGKYPFSVCPPQVQMQPLTYRIATEQPGGNKKRIFNQKDNLLTNQKCKLISKPPQNTSLWKREWCFNIFSNF